MRRLSIRTANARVHWMSTAPAKQFPGYERQRDGKWHENPTEGHTITRGSKRRYRYVRRSVRPEAQEIERMAATLREWIQTWGYLPKYFVRGWPKDRRFRRALRLAKS